MWRNPDLEHMNDAERLAFLRKFCERCAAQVAAFGEQMRAELLDDMKQLAVTSDRDLRNGPLFAQVAAARRALGENRVDIILYCACRYVVDHTALATMREQLEELAERIGNG
jgi:hypothetical protein